MNSPANELSAVCRATTHPGNQKCGRQPEEAGDVRNSARQSIIGVQVSFAGSRRSPKNQPVAARSAPENADKLDAARGCLAILRTM